MLSYGRNYEVDSMGVGAGLYMDDVVVRKFTFAISSPGEFLLFMPRSVIPAVADLLFIYVTHHTHDISAVT